LTKYRRRFDIIADIIGVARPRSKKTKIMYLANLSYALLKRYLDDSMRLGFLRSSGDEYEVTQKGEAFLERYHKFSRYYAQVEKDLEQVKSDAEVLVRMCRLSRGHNRNSRRTKLALFS
jgi:predicted transcriptional regulator